MAPSKPMTPSSAACAPGTAARPASGTRLNGRLRRMGCSAVLKDRGDADAPGMNLQGSVPHEPHRDIVRTVAVGAYLAIGCGEHRESPFLRSRGRLAVVAVAFPPRKDPAESMPSESEN